MHKIRSSLAKEQRPRTSMSFKSFNRELNLEEFIPFSNERDRMGRLIKNEESLAEAKDVPFVNTEGKDVSSSGFKQKM